MTEKEVIMKELIRHLLLASVLTAASGLMVATPATAQTFTNLYNFSASSGGNSTNSDGFSPSAGLVMVGNALFGTALHGGQSGYGSVFRVNADGSGFTNLHSFASGTDGANPVANLLAVGNVLYGTTQFGGSTNGNGTLFKINADGSGYSIVHTFSPNSDGAYPAAGLILSGSFLYGTASGGGTAGGGTIFRVMTNGASFLNLHNFEFGTDGALPYGGLIISGSTLYGTASQAGASGEGVVFKVNNDGNSFATLHAFAMRTLQTNSEGAGPSGTLVLSGNTLYGTAPYGGAFGNGAIFSLHTDGSSFANVHNCTGVADGVQPSSSLVLLNNTLYGTAQSGDGSTYDGTVFSLNVNGSAFTVLHSFSYPNNSSPNTNVDGAMPQAGLILSNFVLYGTASAGGASGSGVVFDLFVHPPFFAGEDPIGSGVYYLTFPNSQFFGFYNYIYFPYLYHYNMGFEYFIDANDGAGGAYLYDFTSGHFWYTSPTYSFPYLYDFNLSAILYYYPDSNNGGQYTSNPRKFFNFGTSNVVYQ